MEVPLMHTQENSNRFVIKVAPEVSLQGFQIPYIEDLINMEPCTLRGKSLLEERKECAFSEPQVRACMGQQPGALGSKRALQPLPTAGLEEEAAFQSGIQMANASWLPFDGAAFTRDTMCSAAWSAQSRTALRRHKRTFTQILQEIERRLQPLQKRSKMRAFPHQRYLVDINIALVFAIMRLIKWQRQAGVDNLDSKHSIRANGSANLAAADAEPDFLFQSCLKKQAKVSHADIAERGRCDTLDGWCQRQPPASCRRRATVAHQRRQRSMSIALPNEDEDADTRGCQNTGCFEA